ncbi:MAG TPA: hypothetical protein VFG63_01130 [Nocardioidaceae bacterium]|nr:hypothetical protein [Nocardioidaceae bacterium]
MIMSMRTRRARMAALSVLLLGVAYLVQVPRLTGLAAYLGVLAGAGVAVAFLAAARLWWGGHGDGRLLATCLSVVGLVGHLLNYVAGVPGASSIRGQVSDASVVAVILELSTLGLLVVDALRRPAAPQRRPPYAL